MSWRVLHASVVGSSHEFAKVPCQDASAFKVLPDGTLIAAVADGAGSARFADQGSTLAVAAAIEDLEERLLSSSPDTEMLKSHLLRAASAARNALESATEARMSSDADATSIGDFATTLLICAVTQDLVAAFQVGDGAVVELSPDGFVAALTRREAGEYFNETTFITSADYSVRASVVAKSRANTESIAMLTDGIQLLAITTATNEPFAPFFLPMFQYARSPNATSEELARFLSSERVCERTDDDKTLLIATPVGSR